MCVFVLVDSRLEPQVIDVDFMEWLALDDIPFVIAFTKTDKLSKNELAQSIDRYKKYLQGTWENFPEYFITSAQERKGKDEILAYIEETNKIFKKP